MVGSLADERYISLTTFKRDGSPVSTPVWVVSDDGRRLLVWTGAGTWKVRRIRRDPRAVVAASSFRGTERGERIEAVARLADVPGIDDLFRRKYGWQKRLVDFLNRKSAPDAWIAIEIADAEAQVTSSSLGLSR